MNVLYLDITGYCERDFMAADRPIAPAKITNNSKAESYDIKSSKKQALSTNKPVGQLETASTTNYKHDDDDESLRIHSICLGNGGRV